MCLCARARECGHTCHVCRGQWMICSWSSSSAMWEQGMKLRFSGLASSISARWAFATPRSLFYFNCSSSEVKFDLFFDTCYPGHAPILEFLVFLFFSFFFLMCQWPGYGSCREETAPMHKSKDFSCPLYPLESCTYTTASSNHIAFPAIINSLVYILKIYYSWTLSQMRFLSKDA